MNASKSISLSTVEDLVQLAVSRASHKWLVDRRYSLEDRTNWVYDDDAAGGDWEKEKDAFDDTRPSDYWSAGYDSPVHKAWDAAIKNWEKKHPQPSKHQEVEYHLYEQGERYHGEIIYLSHDLGKLLDGIWKHGPSWRNAPAQYTKRVGGLTIGGMCKRLGQSDIADKVKIAQDLAKAKEAIRARNYARKQIREASVELAKKIDDAVKAGVGLPVGQWDFSALFTLEDEKE